VLKRFFLSVCFGLLFSLLFGCGGGGGGGESNAGTTTSPVGNSTSPSVVSNPALLTVTAAENEPAFAHLTASRLAGANSTGVVAIWRLDRNISGASYSATLDGGLDISFAFKGGAEGVYTGVIELGLCDTVTCNIRIGASTLVPYTLTVSAKSRI
jgi:hypothetical protein